MTRRRTPRAAAVLTALDAPTAGDHRRIRSARRKARVRAREIEAARREALMEEFRAELGLAVRSASPLLIGMLAIEGLTLDDAVGMLAPGHAWPARPRLSGPSNAKPVHTSLAQYYFATRLSQFSTRSPTQISQYPLISRVFDRSGGGYVRLQVVDHSLEVEARVGPALVETRFGELSVELDFAMPATVYAACAGRLLEEVVDHEAWRGRGWRIAALAEEDESPWGQRLIAATGAVAYRMPWAR